ncbi:histone H1 [Rhodococcus opacus]|nr:histone H1 [Rhodococcus opacus]
MRSTVAQRRRRHMAISPRGSDSSAKKTTKEIREWAIREGREVSLRGRISAEIEQAFYDAQPTKVQAKATPVKKTAATKTAAKKPVATTPGKRAKAPVNPATSSTPPATKTAAKKAAEKKKASTKSVAEMTAVKKPVAAKVSTAGEVVSKAPAKKSSREIREWATGAGHEVSSRGRIPAEIQQAFHEAQAKQVQAKAAPVKNAAAKKAAVRNTAAATARAKKAQAVTAPATNTAVKKTAVKKTAVKKPVAGKAPTAGEVVSKAPAKKSSREIREWATGAGHEVSSRGRIPAEIQQAFHEAQAKQVQAKAAPVKKTAATKTAATKTAATKTAAKNMAEKKRVGEKSAGKRFGSAKMPVTKEVVSKVPAKKSSREIREWAIEAGHEVSSRGRIPAEIQRAFRDAQVEMPVV